MVAAATLGFLEVKWYYYNRHRRKDDLLVAAVGGEFLIPNTIQIDPPINPAILEVEKIVIIVSYSKEYSEFWYFIESVTYLCKYHT
jgi:hypothetical protein